MSKYKRSGDHYLVEISKEEFEKVQGEIMKHNGRFTFGVGEASNHFHIAVVDKPKDMEIKKHPNGLYYFHFKDFTIRQNQQLNILTGMEYILSMV